MAEVARVLEPTGEAEALSILLDADVDRALAALDRVVEAAPSYRKLFSRWESQAWSSEAIDFARDRLDWRSGRLSADQREFLSWGLSAFFLGEERVTTELLPFAIAVPSHEARAFLATQISDEARHMVFFDRFLREVLETDAPTLTRNLERARPAMSRAWCELFDGILHDSAEALRRDPSDTGALVRGVTVYMIVIEGTLALTGSRFIMRGLREHDLLPGFCEGFTAVNRDESRHVGFGVRFLADAVRTDAAHRRTVEETLRETLPVATLALVPPMVEDPLSFTTPFGHSSSEMYEYALRSLAKRLAAIGMEPLGRAA